MINNINRFLLVLLMSYTSVFSFGQRLDIYDFYSMNKQDKTNFISSMQKFSVNMEQYHIDRMSKLYSYQEIRFFLEKIIPSAIAQKASKSSKLCMYAGWISYIPKKAGPSGYCTHPSRYVLKDVPDELKELIKNEQKRYEDFKKDYYPDGCANRHKIMCNPELYGTNLTNGKPFCVVGNPQPQNSSFQCLRAFETHEKREEILDDIIESNMDKDNGIRLQTLINIIDDACICGSKSKIINKHYAKRMFKTQTCFAWVAQARNVSKKACIKYSEGDESLTPILDFSQSVYNRAQRDLLKSGISSKSYTEIIENKDWLNTDWKKRRSNLKQLCSDPPPPIKKEDKYAIFIKKLELKEDTYPIEATVNINDLVQKELKELKIRWMKRVEPAVELETTTSFTTNKVTTENLPITVYAELLKGDDVVATSSDLKFELPKEKKAAQEDKKKYSISISKGDLKKDNMQILLSEVQIDDKKIEKLDGLEIKWLVERKKEEKVDSTKTPSDAFAGSSEEQETDKDDEIDESDVQLKEFDSSKESFESKLKLIKEKQIVQAALFDGDEEVAISKKLTLEIAAKTPLAKQAPQGFQGAPRTRRSMNIHGGNR